MKYLIERRLSLLDSICISAMCILIVQGHFLMALVVACIGVLVSLILQAYYGKRATDKLWQQFSDQGRKIDAIRKHRQLYNSTLKDSLEAVTAYEAKLKR